MTTVRDTKCVHCGDRYEYITSGALHGSTQNAHYCPGCYRVVLESLRAIPRKFETIWSPTKEVTLELLQEWEQEESQEKNQSNGLPRCRRVSSPLYQLTEQGTVAQVSQIVRGRRDFAFRIFQYAYWPGKEDEVVITEEVERNCVTGQTRPIGNITV